MRRSLLLTLLVVLATAAFAFAAAGDPTPVTYNGAGGGFVGLRPTGVGLPQIGAGGTIGAGELASVLRNYHDSGRYDRDLAAVVASARADLDKRLDQAANPAKKVCRRRYLPVARRPRLYRRRRVCSLQPQPAITGKPAIVLDIDETSLSNYSSLATANFTSAGLLLPAALGTGAVIAPTLSLFKHAKDEQVAVFFVTGRPAAVSGPTQTNLKAVGFSGWDGLTFKPGGVGTATYKAGERAKLEQRGYDILVNVGDQESDLDGGHADRAFKLPNPFYFIADS